MESKEPIDRRSTPTPFPYGEKGGSERVRSLDCLALLKLCVGDPNNVGAWDEFSSRFKDKIRLFVSRASQSLWTDHPLGSSSGRAASEPDGEDLVQEVFLRLIADDCRLLKHFEGETEESFLCYLWVISSSAVISHYRRIQAQRRSHISTSLEQVNERLLDQIGIRRDDLKMERSILINEIVKIVDDFLQEEISEPETRKRYRLIFKLHLFGLSLSEISRYCRVNLSKPGIEKIIAKIIEHLRKRLGRRGVEHG